MGANHKSRESIGVRLGKDKMERLRNAIFWLGQGKTINGLIEEGVDYILEKLETNNGGPFRDRTGPIPKGRT